MTCCSVCFSVYFCDVVVVCGSSEASAKTQLCAETSPLCKLESQSADHQAQSCQTQSSDTQSESHALSSDHDAVELCTSVHSVDTCCLESESPVTDRDITDVTESTCHMADRAVIDNQDVTVSTCHMADRTVIDNQDVTMSTCHMADRTVIDNQDVTMSTCHMADRAVIDNQDVTMSTCHMADRAVIDNQDVTVSTCHMADRAVIDNQDVTMSTCHTGLGSEMSACITSCEKARTDECEVNGCRLTQSVDSSTLMTNHLAKHQSEAADICDTIHEAVVNNMQHLSGATDLHVHSAGHENLTVSSVAEPDLQPCNDSNVLLDIGSYDVLSAEAESETPVGFSDSAAVHVVDGKCETSATTQAVSLARNSDGASHVYCTAADRSICSLDTVATCASDSLTSSAASVMDSCVTKLSVKSGVHCILTASLSEVSRPAEETVAHIGSTCVHVTDELSIINGVVRPVESGVKIGEFLLLSVLYV